VSGLRLLSFRSSAESTFSRKKTGIIAAALSIALAFTGATPVASAATVQSESSISGTVKDTAGALITGDVAVNVYDSADESNFITSASVEVDGTYVVTGLVEGSYKLQFYAAGNYISQWWNNETSFDAADAISVGPADTLTGNDVVLVAGASIAGTITDASGAAITSGGAVNVYDSSDQDLGALYSGEIREDGTYSVTGLVGASYKIQFTPSGNYLRQWWGNEATFDTADSISVASEAALTGYDAALVVGASIAGTITDSTGAGISTGGSVEVYNSENQWDGALYSAAILEDGTYSLFGLPAGTYKVRFAAEGNYVRQWWNNEFSFDNADAITLATGQTVTGTDAVVTAGASIAGTVTDESGNPITAGGDVSAYPAADEREAAGSASIQEDGTYAITGLAAGSYKLQFGAPETYVSQWWNNKKTFVTAGTILVTAGQTVTGRDAVLARTASLSGTVKDSSGNPVTSGGYVFVYDAASQYQTYHPPVDIQSDGTYTFASLDPGSYKMEFRPTGNYIAQFWNNKTSFATGNSITLLSGRDVTGKDVVLKTGGTISGTVKDSLGKPITGGEWGSGQVCPTLASEQNSFLNNGNCGQIQEDGSYTVTGLPTGSYKLEFTPEGNYLSEWWNDKASFATADALAVTAGRALTGKNAVLTTAASISGTVSAQGSPATPLAGINVTALDPVTFANVGSATTGDDGKYTIIRVKPGTYTLVFDGRYSSPSYKIALLGNASTYETSTRITVATSSTITKKNATLVRRVAGTQPPAPIATVTNPTGLHDVVTWSQPASADPILGYDSWGSGHTATGGGGGGGGPTYGSNLAVLFPASTGVSGTESWSSKMTLVPFTGSTDGRSASVFVSDTVSTPLEPAPTVTVTSRTSTTLTMTWAGQVAPASPMAQWHVELTGDDSSEVQRTVNSGNPLTYTFTHLKAGVVYTVGVFGSTDTTTTYWGAPKVFTLKPVPTISGAAAVGSTLTAIPGTWDSGAKLTYQWRSEGTDISDATDATYQVQSSDLGRKISVVVTGKKTGYDVASPESRSTASVVLAALVPTFSSPVKTATGFTVNVTNYNSLYSFAPSITAGTASVTAGIVSGENLPLTITGMSPNASATVRVLSSRSGYDQGSATVVGTALKGAALTPTFSTPVKTATGFTVNVKNYSSLYTFTPSITGGTAIVRAGTASGSTLPLTITGMGANASATVQVLTTRASYDQGSATVVGSASLGAALTPTFSAPVPTASGFTVNVTNFSALYTFTPSIASGGGTVVAGAPVGSTLQLTITGVSAGATKVAVATTRSDYAAGSSTVSSFALPVVSTVTTQGNPTVAATRGTSITITGINVVGATSVTIGGVVAPAFTVTSPTTVVIGVWATAVTGVVKVVTPGGTATSGTSLTVSSTLTAPTLSSIGALSVTTGGPGTAVTVTGTNLGAVSQVKRGTKVIPFKVLSETQIVLAIPTGVTTGSFVFTTPGGTVTSAPFTATPSAVVPTVTSTGLSAALGTALTITGSNLGAATGITIGGTAATIWWVTDAGTLSLYIPATTALGTASVVVTTPGGSVTAAVAIG